MSEKLLTRNDIAAKLKTTPDIAASILAEHNVHPINWGTGRSRGYRWPESMVDHVIRCMYAAAQPKPLKRKPQKLTDIPEKSLADMTNKEVKQFLALTNAPPIQ